MQQRKGTLKESTWTGKCTHFHSFVPLRYKINLVNTRSYTIRTICSTDVIEDELNVQYGMLTEGSYPEKIVTEHMGMGIEN